ncbi:phage tail protein [Lysobacter olei]
MGGKNKSQTVGYWYKVLYHAGLGAGPIDAFLEFRGGDKTAWRGELASSGTIRIFAPNLWGGEKDQGGIWGDVDLMFGEATQSPNPYLLENLGSQVPAWRGLATLVFKGGRYGAMNPYPQKASYKIRKIKKGWDNDACWYPEKAEIPYGSGGDSTGGYFLVSAGSEVTNVAGGETVYGTVAGDFVGTADEIGAYCINVRNTAEAGSYTPEGSVLVGIHPDDPSQAYISGWSAEGGPNVGIAGVPVTAVCPLGYAVSYVENGDESSIGVDRPTINCTLSYVGVGMNPAHALYYARTSSDIGREPTANLNAASYAAAADKLHAEGFGICTAYDPGQESLEEFEQRICRLIGGSVSQSLVDGQWYLELAREDYVLADLPVLTDEDILAFSEQPTTLDGTINSLSVRYFDPERKEAITTPPAQALALVDAFGVVHQTNDYPEIPSSALAARVAERDLRAAVTPTRAFELTTTRKAHSWRSGQYFRLQSPKRGIADMVCIVGEMQTGTLRSGAIKLKAAQDIYSLPTAGFVEVEPGVDTGPSPMPQAITAQRAFEAPYTEVVQALSRADLDALPSDVGFLMAVAEDPASSRDYSVSVAQDGLAYATVASADWSPATTILGAAGRLETAFFIASGSKLGEVVVGSAAIWDDEVVRVDAIDAVAGTMSLGRGCADTVPQEHLAGSRIWFYGVSAAADVTEYTAAETISVKLLTNTGSQQLAEPLATTMTVDFDSRAARPYPPAGLKINGDAYPAAAYGALTATWVHRDRVLQADQLLDATQASVGPEPGTTYTVRWYSPAGTLLSTEAGVSGTASSPYTPPASGTVRVTVESVRDGLGSWQLAEHTLAWAGTPPDVRISESGDRRITEDGDVRVTE